MMDDLKLWRTADGARWFLFAVEQQLLPGDLTVAAVDGRVAQVDARWASLHEVGEARGRDWAREQLGQTLEELKQGIDATLEEGRRQIDEFKRTPVADDTTITPGAVPAMFELLKKLPRVIVDSLSGDVDRIDEAREAMVRLQRRLRHAGIDLDQRFSSFPDRLAGLRQEFGERRSGVKPPDSDG
jgi:hypothetical protein